MHLLLESMKWNPTVKFIVIHVIEEGSTQADKLIALKADVGVPNLQIVAISIPAFSALVNDKLGLTVKMTAAWFYKLCDYKPTLGFLFADMIPESDFKVEYCVLNVLIGMVYI